MQDSRRTVQHAELFCEDESQRSILPNWFTSAKLVYKALMLVMASLLLAGLFFSCLPLLRPIGGLVLQRLWDVLRFLLLTTGIGLGILNSGSWRAGGNGTEDKAKQEGSVSSKVPFAGMFYGELQPSYPNSFVDRDVDMNEGPVMSRNGSRNDGGKEVAMSMEAVGMAAGKDDVNSAAAEEDMEHIETENGAAKCDNDAEDNNVATSRETEVKPVKGHEVGLAAVVAASEQQFVEKRGKNIVHRRGSSLMEFPSKEQQEYWAPRFANDDMATNRRLPASDNLSSSGKVPVLALNHAARKAHNVIDGASRKAPESSEIFSISGKISSMAENGLLGAERKGSESSKVSLFVGNNVVDGVDRKVSEVSTKLVPSSTDPATSHRTKHTRSRSELDMEGLLVKQQQQPIESKPATSSSQVSRRRNVSLSCDLDKEFTKMGVPASRLFALPSPPTPPFMFAMDGDPKPISTESDLFKEGDSSLRKAFSESLAPWRSVSTVSNAAAPVNVSTSSSRRKQSMSSRINSRVQDDLSPSPRMGSPSPGELNKKVDAFIARFHEQMRLQRLESLEQSRQRHNR